MQTIHVIRFGALGDLCLTGWTLARLAQGPQREGRRVVLVTKERFAALAEQFTGVDAVESLAEPGRLGDLVRLAANLRRQHPDTIIDAHGVLRSRLLLGLLGRRPQARLRKDTVARLRLLQGGAESTALRQHLRQRLDSVMDRAALPSGEAVPPLAHLAPATPPAATLGLSPGAQWDTKRWPESHWVDLARRALDHGDRIRIFLGPREELWFPGGPLEQALAGADGVEFIRGRSLLEAARALAGCRRLVCNDSGLMHLSEAVGTPVTAFFGPTVRAFGYAPVLPDSRLLEVADLNCRPCSRNGKKPCHRGDLACLTGISADDAWRAVGSEAR